MRPRQVMVSWVSLLSCKAAVVQFLDSPAPCWTPLCRALWSKSAQGTPDHMGTWDRTDTGLQDTESPRLRGQQTWGC
jgi:hypothetical protein